jgi:signal transduction histidine kinase
MKTKDVTHTILVVDDDTVSLKVIAAYLKTLDSRVLTAHDGKSGIESALHERPDLILLDIVMPEMDGFEVGRRLKVHETTKDIPVIFMTGLTATEHKIKGFQMGAVDCISKPIQEEVVLARITTHLRLREMNKRLQVHERTDEPAAITEALQLNQQLQQAIAERNIVRCDNIINELLDYTRDRRLHLQLTDVDAWLNTILDEQSIPEDIVCVRELEATVQIPIDRESLRRAIINVVENAVHALTEGPSLTRPKNQLTVSACVTPSQASSRLEIRVSDTGPGNPDDVRARIFEPLFSTKHYGVGLGLPIVKNIVEQHGGGIEIESQAGQGTTVILWLPVRSLGN